MSEECPKCEDGLPGWLATFADLMSLLMCFFVLLLSFAEIDAIRFKKMAESMKDAFGVQREIPATEIVKGVSVIKQEFSPSTIPEPSPLDDIRQQTTDAEREHLDMKEGTKDEPAENDQQNLDEAMEAALAEKLKQEVKEKAEELMNSLAQEIHEGLLNIETEGTKIIIRIQEKGSFPSGSASLDPDFFEVMDRIGKTISTMPGKIIVAGHTDDIPISTSRFRSNWELSSARAVTVVHALLSNPTVEPNKVLVEGHADSHPLAPNDTPLNRAKNRRVELIIRHEEDQVGGDPGAVTEKPTG